MTLGEVLHKLAKRKKLGAYQIARALDVYATTVYDWWKDKYAPNEENLRRYAALMEVPVEQLRGSIQNGQDKQRVAELVYAVLARIAAGEEPATAFIAVTAAPSIVTNERRAALKEAARLFTATLSDLAGQDWETAPREVREQVLEDMRTELLDA